MHPVVANLGRHKLFALAARTATPTPVEFPTENRAKGCRVVIVTTASSTPSTTFTIQAYDESSATWYTLLASAAVAANGTTTLIVYPGVVTASNAALNSPLPGRCRLTPTHGNANSHTYAATVELFG